MSEIRATTISDSAGTGPIALTKQIATKAFAYYSGSSVLGDSLNISSATDTGTTGRTDVAMTSAMSSSTYAVNASANETSSDRFAAVDITDASNWRTYSFDGATRTDLTVGTSVHGDLA